MARPSKYSQALAERICERLADGESLRSICRSAEMPVVETIRTWLRTRPEFLAQYARAREEQADYYAEDMLEIADASPALDDAVQVARAKLRVDTRKWIMARMAPKKYGDRIQQEVSGPGGAAIEHVHKIERTIVRPDHSDS